jgi:hypothetical protein
VLNTETVKSMFSLIVYIENFDKEHP